VDREQTATCGVGGLHAPCSHPPPWRGHKTTGFTPVRKPNSGKGIRALLPHPEHSVPPSHCWRLGTAMHTGLPGTPLVGYMQRGSAVWLPCWPLKVTIPAVPEVSPWLPRWPVESRMDSHL
jgi:hypothetical protein